MVIQQVKRHKEAINNKHQLIRGYLKNLTC